MNPNHKFAHQSINQYLAGDAEPPAGICTRKEENKRMDDYLRKKGMVVGGWRVRKKPATVK